MGVEQWLGGEKREVKSLLIKIGAAASLSFAGYLFYSHERTSGSGTTFNSSEILSET